MAGVCLVADIVECSQGLHSYFQANDFLQVHTPILTSNDCEGAGEMFRIAKESTCSPAAYEALAAATDHLYFDSPQGRLLWPPRVLDSLGPTARGNVRLRHE